MHRFTHGEIDVLLCTSIIESGLDIPNANTLIVDRGDTFGLAQLYQLRGRVGRGAQRAYAYFFRHRKQSAHPRRAGTPGSDRREHPAGRGLFDRHARPGNARRGRTAGHPPARLYRRGRLPPVHPPAGPGCAPDAPGVRAARAAGKKFEFKDGHMPVSVDLPLSVGIPVDYVPDQNMRLQLYRRLADLQNEQEVRSLAEELRDRFGPLPEQVSNLIFQMSVKLRAEVAGLASVTAKESRSYCAIHRCRRVSASATCLLSAIIRALEKTPTGCRCMWRRRLAGATAGCAFCYNGFMPTILIVEDEQELVKVLRSYLEKAGYQVISALRGDSGLDLFDREQPDLVLLDLNLPGLDGLDVAREIRQRGNTPMIMVTARVEK